MCMNCPQLKVHLDKIESKFKKLLIERNQHLNEIFDMKSVLLKMLENREFICVCL